MGKMFEVEIVECNKFSMKGKLVNESLLLSQRPVELKIGQVTGLKSSVSPFLALINNLTKMLILFLRLI